MHEEFRDEWECCQVLHAGDGPEHTAWETILVARTSGCSAVEAAQAYAEGIMVDMFRTRDDYDDGSEMIVAVKATEGIRYFSCIKRIQAIVNVGGWTPAADFVLAP